MKQFFYLTLALFGFLSYGSPVEAQQTPDQAITTLNVPIINNANASIGEAQFRGGENGVVMRVKIMAGSLSPGWHGIHFHEKPDCSDFTVFKNAGGHINHSGKKHGLLNPQGPDDGNLPNLHVQPDGSAEVEMFSNFVRLDGAPNALAQGAALIIHQQEDDHVTQPIGGSGARAACALIKR